MKYNHQQTFYTEKNTSKAFNYAIDIEKRPIWQTTLKGAKLLDDSPVKLGTKFEEDGQQGIVVLQFVEFDFNKRIRYKTIKGKGVFADIFWDFETENNQTKINVSITLYPKGIFKILFPILFPFIIKPNIKKELKTLKQEIDNIK